MATGASGRAGPSARSRVWTELGPETATVIILPRNSTAPIALG